MKNQSRVAGTRFSRSRFRARGLGITDSDYSLCMQSEYYEKLLVARLVVLHLFSQAITVDYAVHYVLPGKDHSGRQVGQGRKKGSGGSAGVLLQEHATCQHRTYSSQPTGSC